MKKLLLIIAAFISLQGFSQISHGGEPTGKNKNSIPVYTTPILNVQPYIEEDKVTDKHKDIAWRFGIEQFVTLNLSNSGNWATLANGDRIWQLKIASSNAKTINLNYSKFNLPVGATFFVYNKNQTLGSFTSENNKLNGEFSTSLLKGDYVVLEYFEPAIVQGQGIIEISSVVHGYRNLFNHLKAFGSSGACNINAVCDTSYWGNEIRSAVMLLTSGNSRFCSGALVNNVLQDGKPFVLTANHCGPSSNNIFMFNYQSSTCNTNTDGFTTQTISGCTIRANDVPSDFFLVELSSIPPSNYNVFYSGWSSVNTIPTKGTGIHFPALDVKKISHDDDNLIESGYYTAGNNHWEVLDWNSGTTEGGSSGSPLFDQNHRIVGQLHGGDAACGNDAFDFYGKFSVSWDTDASSSKQLKFWLDPNNSGTTVIDGYDPNNNALTTDAVLLDLSGIETFICGDSISPKILIRNHGSALLTSLDINYELDGGGVTTINWVGNLNTYAIDSVIFPTIYIPGGSHSFTVDCNNPNGTIDENTLNNSASINFTNNGSPLFATLDLTTDNFGAETSWLIRNVVGDIIVSSKGYPNITGGQNYIENLCLYEDCFTFVFKDSYGDGFCCGANGNGSLSLTEDATGDTLAINNTFSGDSLVFNFCMGSATGINEIEKESFNIYPNPSSGIFTIETYNSNPFNVTIHNILGEVIYQKKEKNSVKTQIDLSNKKTGIYFISINSEKNKVIKKIIIR